MNFFEILKLAFLIGILIVGYPLYKKLQKKLDGWFR
jgi:hypothetical protein